MVYGYKDHKGDPKEFRTIRIGTQKSFPNGKTISLVYERSQDLHEFNTEGEKRMANIKLENPPDMNTYMIRSITKLERVSDRYTKAYIYCEMFWPEAMSLQILRRKTISLLTSSYA